MRTDLHYGVAAGINRYPELSNLNFAVSDAEEFYKWMLESGITDDRADLVKVDDAEVPEELERKYAKPKRDEIWDALWERIEQVRDHVKHHPKDWPETRLYFFFSGHGIAPAARDASGLAADAGPSHYGKAVSMKLLIEYLLDAQPFGELVIISDCCRNWPRDQVPLAGPPWTPAKTQNGVVRVTEFYATIYGDPAREPDPARNPNAERGYFTRALLDGLRGKAIADRNNGTVTSHSLIEYARDRVSKETRGEQKPPQDVGASLVLATGAVAPTMPVVKQQVRIALPAGFSGLVVLKDADLEEVDRFTADGSDWVIGLDPGLYLVEAADSTAFAANGLFKVDPTEGEFNVSLIT